MRVLFGVVLVAVQDAVVRMMIVIVIVIAVSVGVRVSDAVKMIVHVQVSLLDNGLVILGHRRGSFGSGRAPSAGVSSDAVKRTASPRATSRRAARSDPCTRKSANY